MSANNTFSDSCKEPKTFIAACADGRVIRWIPEYENSYKTLLHNTSNSYQSISYSPDGGSMFVCAGKLPCIEVYDETTCQKVVEFKSTIGHNNKIFCAKFDCEDSNVIYSGGWDRQVLFWDVR